MGKPWFRTAEQDKYLQEQVKELLKARLDDTVKNFRHQLHETWEARWPEIKVLFPQRTDTDPQLTREQIDELSSAMSLRKQQLYTRVRWLVGTKPIRTKNPKTLLARYLRKVQSIKDKKVTRKRTMLSIYSDLYFKKTIQPLVNAALEGEPSSLSKPEHASRQLKHYQRIRAECWASESPEVREEVLKIYDTEHNGDEEDEENEEDETDEDEDEKSLLVRQQECIEIIGSVINSFLQDASEATGFSFILIGGGLDKEGSIKMCMSSVGKTIAGKTFMSTHKDWEEGVSKPFKEFLCLRHPHEERLHRASLWAEKSQSPASSAPLALADAQPPTMPNSDVSPIIQPKSLPVQVLTVPSPNITVPNPQATSLIPQTTLDPSSAPTPNQASSLNSGIAVQVSTVPSPNITAPNPQATSLIPQTTLDPSSAQTPNQASLLFAPNSTQTFSDPSNFQVDANPQQSLMSLMSEVAYSWPTQSEDQDLFNFSGFQDSSGTNNFDIDTNFFSPGVDFTSFIPVAHANGNNLNTPANINTVSHVPANTLSHTNVNTPSLNQFTFTPVAHANSNNLNTPANTNAVSHVPADANNDTPADANTLSHANITNAPAYANTQSHANVNTSADANTPGLNQNIAKKSRKRKSDDADLVLPDGSRRVRKKKGRPDENIPVNTKKTKGRK